MAVWPDLLLKSLHHGFDPCFGTNCHRGRNSSASYLHLRRLQCRVLRAKGVCHHGVQTTVAPQLPMPRSGSPTFYGSQATAYPHPRPLAWPACLYLTHPDACLFPGSTILSSVHSLPSSGFKTLNPSPSAAHIVNTAVPKCVPQPPAPQIMGL